MLVTSLFPFVIRFFMIQKWGLEYLGISGLFASVLQVMNIAELGIGNAILFSMYKPMSENDVSTVNALLNLYRIIYKVLGIVLLFVGLIILPLIKYLISGDYPADVNIYIIYLIHLLNTVIGYVVNAYWDAIPRANQKIDAIYKIGIAVTSIMYILQIVIICNSHNYYFYIILLPVTTLIINSLKAKYAKRVYPAIHCEGNVKYSFIREFCKRIFAMALSKIRTAIRNSIDSLAISANLGLIALAKYQNYYQIMCVPIILIGILKGAMLPIYGIKVATDSKEDNYHVFELYSFVNNWVSTWCTVCMYCMMQNIITLWTGKGNLLSDSIVFCMCIYFYIYSFSENAVMIRETTGEWWIGHQGAIVESVLNLVLNIILVKYFGILGVLVATIVTLLFVNLPVEYGFIFKKYFRVKASRYFRCQLIYLINAMIICIATKKLYNMFITNSLKSLVIKATICIVIPNVMYIGLNFYSKEFKELLLNFKRLVKSE